MENKTVEMTKVVALGQAIELAKQAEKVELAEKLEKMLATETKVSSRKRGESKTTKAKKADIEILQDWFMAESDPEEFYTAKDLILAIPDFKDYSSQKMTARLSQMVKDGQLDKGDKAKRVAYKVK